MGELCNATDFQLSTVNARWTDLKSLGRKLLCRFESGRPHHHRSLYGDPYLECVIAPTLLNAPAETRDAELPKVGETFTGNPGRHVSSSPTTQQQRPLRARRFSSHRRPPCRRATAIAPLPAQGCKTPACALAEMQLIPIPPFVVFGQS
jgi:hypothetical protein